MDIKNILTISIATCALLFSCKGPDTEVTYDKALEYAKEHYKLEKEVAAKSGTIEWNLYDSSEKMAKSLFSGIKQYFKDQSIELKVSGSAEINDAVLKTPPFINYTIISEMYEDVKNATKFYINDIGLKTCYTMSIPNNEQYYETQYDKQGRGIYFIQRAKGSNEGGKFNYLNKTNFTY